MFKGELGRRHGSSLEAIPGVWTMGLIEPVGSFARAQMPTRRSRTDESVHEEPPHSGSAQPWPLAIRTVLSVA